MFYQYFKFKATGVPLTGVADFTAAPVGTEFEKNSGEIYIKDANGIYNKVDRIIQSRAENDTRYGQLDFTNTWSLGNTFDGALTSTGTNIFSGDNTFETGVLVLDSDITSGGSNIWNGTNLFNTTSTFAGGIVSSNTNTWNGVQGFNDDITFSAGAPIASSGNNVWNGTQSFNSNCAFALANTFGGHQTPVTTGIYDLGSTSKRWNDIWCSGDITAENLNTVGLSVYADVSNNAYTYFWDFSSSTWRTFGWDNAADTFIVEDGAGVQREILHSGNFTSYGATPVGAAAPFFGGTVHSGYIKANGAAISRVSYATLFAEIGETYGVGNGTTTFNVPDSRGEFLRGWDDARGIDSGRALGSWQADELKAHTHPLQIGWTVPAVGWRMVWTQGQTNGVETQTNPNTGSAGGTETRPRNLAVQYLIKY
jgi:microcystin-dependent protein